MSPKRNLVVVGNGMAGARAVEEILARGGKDQFNITVFGDEPYGNYNRILLSNVLNGSQDPTEIFLNPRDWYAANDVTLHAPARVTHIDRTNKTLDSDAGISASYDLLMVATGSRPFIPPIDGITMEDGKFKPGIFVFRTIDDCHKIAGYATKSRKAVVIGGGLLGLEAARGLLNYGVEVHVVHAMPWLMNNQLDRPAGNILRAEMEKLGVKFHLEKLTSSIDGDESVTGLTFKDGTQLPCDMVVISAGIIPNSEVGAECGLTVKRGIVVDDQMRSIDDPSVFVVGECAEHNGKLYGLVAPLWDQGQVLADVITGQNSSAAYKGSKLATKLKVMGVDLASMGITEPRDEHDEVLHFAEPKKGIYKKLIIRDDILVGAILLGDTSKAAPLMQSFDRELALPDERVSLLFDLGEAATQTTLLEMPDSAQVCNCNGVSKGAIRKCVESGKRSLKMVMEATRAGTGCGSCKKLVEEVVNFVCDGQVEEDPSIHYYVPGVPMPKSELVHVIKERGLRSVSSVFEVLAGGHEDVSSKMGLASLLKTVWGAEYVDERDSRYINDRVHANIQKDGTFSVIPQMPGGVTSSDQLRRIADVADKYNVPMVKLTGGQRIDLLGIAKENLPGVWKDLDMPSGYAYSKTYRTCKSCVGTEFCRYGVGDSTSLALKIEQKFQGLESPAKLKLATAGCPRNCSEAMVKDVGAVAVEGGKWEIYIGGAAGAHVRKGDILCVVKSHDEVIKYTGRFMQYYRENARYLERTYGFLDRIGISKIRAIVVDDVDGIAERLDRDMEISLEAYKDPWTEASAPATTNQFASVLPMVQN